MTNQKVAAEVLRNQIDWTMHCISSLQSCRNWEVPNETNILKGAIEKLLPMVPKRKNDELTGLQGRVIARANESIAKNAGRVTAKPANY